MEKMTGSMAGKGSMVGKMPGKKKVVNGLFVYRLVIGQGDFPFPPFLPNPGAYPWFPC